MFVQHKPNPFWPIATNTINAMNELRLVLHLIGEQHKLFNQVFKQKSWFLT